MAPSQELSFKELFAFIIGDMARAISQRQGEDSQNRFMRAQVATLMILGLAPRDVVEAMLAGHSVMFHALMTDSILETLRGEVDPMRRATRANIVGLNNAFHMNLGKLARYQTRPSEGIREAAEESPPEPVQPPATDPQPSTESSEEITVLLRTTPEVAAACRANPEAMAALDSGDPERFALAMGLVLADQEHQEAEGQPEPAQANRSDESPNGGERS